jgi:tripartite-type tricarboxylate transporter receptor subunit TctC
MKTLQRFLAAALMLGLASFALAQSWPTKAITLVVPFPAGGPTDTLARIMSERMGRALGQTVIVENVTGAAGTIGVGKVVRANPDGYTLGIGHWGTHVVNPAAYPLNYDVVADLDPVGMIATNPQLLVVKLGVPANDLKEFIAWLKANPDKASAGTSGVGSASHVGGLYFQSITGTKFQFIPYRGTGPAMQDLLGGQIDLMFDQAANALPQVRAGKVKGFAVTSPKRLASAPDIPTVDEAGAPGLYIAIWHAIWAPKGTPKDVLAKLNAALVESLADPATAKRFVDLGQDIPPREQQSPEALGSHHRAEIAKWWPLLKAAGVKGE